MNRSSYIALSSFPAELKPETLSNLLKNIDSLGICAGQTDDHFLNMATAKKRVFKSNDDSPVAVIDDYAPVFLNGKCFTDTIRTIACDVLVHGVKCYSCMKYRAKLRALYKRWCSHQSSQITETTSHTNERYLSTPEKKTKMIKMNFKHGLTVLSKRS